MSFLDLSYLTTVGVIGATARACSPLLPVAWRQRLEAAPPPGLEAGWVWVHAVSVGELLLAPGLVERLLALGERVHITTGTPAGLELLGRRLSEWDQNRGLLSGGAFPLDDPQGLEAFLVSPPKLFLALETELWPNLLRTLEAKGIPKVIVNGRLTSRSTGRALLREAAGRLDLVAARDPASAEGFRSLGAPRVALGGNLKADLLRPKPLPSTWAPLRQAWGGDPVVVAGNTVEGEEALVLEAWKAAQKDWPGVRLMLAPRKPARFEEVAKLLSGEGITFARASAWPEHADWANLQALLLDTLGDLPSAYGEGTVALVGGGWRWTGGHNPLEPVRWGLPTLLGPGCENFKDLTEPLLREGRVAPVPAESLSTALREALKYAPLRGPGFDQGRPLPDELRGALDRTWNLVEPFLFRSNRS